MKICKDQHRLQANITYFRASETFASVGLSLPRKTRTTVMSNGARDSQKCSKVKLLNSFTSSQFISLPLLFPLPLPTHLSLSLSLCLCLTLSVCLSVCLSLSDCLRLAFFLPNFANLFHTFCHSCLSDESASLSISVPTLSCPCLPYFHCLSLRLSTSFAPLRLC